MIANAQAEVDRLSIYHDDGKTEVVNTQTKEITVILPEMAKEIAFTVPVLAWQGNGS